MSPFLKMYEEYVDYWATIWKGWARFWFTGEITRLRPQPVDYMKFEAQFFQ